MYIIVETEVCSDEFSRILLNINQWCAGATLLLKCQEFCEQGPQVGSFRLAILQVFTSKLIF